MTDTDKTAKKPAAKKAVATKASASTKKPAVKATTTKAKKPPKQLDATVIVKPQKKAPAIDLISALAAEQGEATPEVKKTSKSIGVFGGGQTETIQTTRISAAELVSAAQCDPKLEPAPTISPSIDIFAPKQVTPKPVEQIVDGCKDFAGFMRQQQETRPRKQSAIWPYTS